SSRWFLMRTIESFNGQRFRADQGTFITWYSANAFGGTNFSSTPVGAISYTDEPGGVPPDVERNDINSFYSLWENGHRFVVCAWKSRNTHFHQPVGDPFVKR